MCQRKFTRHVFPNLLKKKKKRYLTGSPRILIPEYDQSNANTDYFFQCTLHRIMPYCVMPDHVTCITLDCEQSLFCSKNRKEERKTTERARYLRGDRQSRGKRGLWRPRYSRRVASPLAPRVSCSLSFLFYFFFFRSSPRIFRPVQRLLAVYYHFFSYARVAGKRMVIERGRKEWN